MRRAVLAFPIALAACAEPEPIPPVVEVAAFCDLVTENFRYTQAEIDGRLSAGWTANLRREFEINKHRDRECEEGPPALTEGP